MVNKNKLKKKLRYTMNTTALMIGLMKSDGTLGNPSSIIMNPKRTRRQ